MKKIITITLLALLTLGLFISCNSEAVEGLLDSKYKIREDGSWAMGNKVYPDSTKPYILVVPKDINWQQGIDEPTIMANLKPLEDIRSTKTETDIGFATVQYQTDDTGLEFYYYIGSRDETEAQNIFMRTKDDYTETILLDAPNDEFSHYGSLNVATVDGIALDSYYEYGYVRKVVLKLGHLVAEQSSKIDRIVLDKESTDTTTVITIKNAEHVDILKPEGASVTLEENLQSPESVNVITVTDGALFIDADGNSYKQGDKLPAKSTLLLLTDTDDYTFDSSYTLDLFGFNINGNLKVNEGVNAVITCSVGSGTVKDKDIEVATDSNLSVTGGRYASNPSQYIDIYCYKVAKGVEDTYYKVVSIDSKSSIYANPLCFTAEEAGATVKLVKTGTPTNVLLKYTTSSDGSNWQDYDITENEGATITLSKVGDKVYFRAPNTNSGFSTSADDYFQFVIGNKNTAVSGNIMSLVDATCQETTVESNEFISLFASNTNLKDAKDLVLPAEILAENCYERMFQSCTNLKSLTVGFTSWTDALSKNATKNWLENAGSDDSVISVPNELGTPSSRNSSTIPENWKIALKLPEGQKGKPVSFTASSDNTKVWMEATDDTLPTDILAYSSNNKDWFQYTIGNSSTSATEILLSNSDTVYFKAKEKSENGQFSTSSSNYVFKAEGESTVSGNIMYLVDPTGRTEEVSEYAFNNLFEGNEALTSASELKLPAEELAKGCYEDMFESCTNLKTAPKLPAETLAEDCYKEMFKDCTSLTDAPDLPAEELVEGCYARMFQSCTDIESLTVGFTSWTDAKNKKAIEDWLEDAGSESSIITVPSELDTPEERSSSTVPDEWQVALDLPDNEDGDPINFKSGENDTVVWVTATDDTLPTDILAYSKDNENWFQYTIGNSETTPTKITLSDTDKVYFKSKKKSENGQFSTSSSNYIFKSEGKADVSGNIMYLVDPTGETDEVSEYAFNNLFEGNEALTSASELELPAEELAKSCYEDMFESCTNLKSAPELPATTMTDSCYKRMFKDCTSLTDAPVLPAQNLADSCYEEMFKDCTSLESLSVGFTSWTDAASKNATKNWLENAGSSSSTITIPSELGTPAASSGDTIPSGWSNEYRPEPLCFTAEEAGATVTFGKKYSPENVTIVYSTDNKETWNEYTLGTQITLADVGNKVFFKAGKGGNSHFSKATNSYYYFALNNKKISASGNVMSLLNSEFDIKTIPTEGCFASLFEGCSSLTAAPELPATTLSKDCYSCMFKSCKALTTVPELPATTLAENCYFHMFQNCLGLTSLPRDILTATNLAKSCYERMFADCKALTTITELPATTLAEECYSNMFNGCTSLTSLPENLLPAKTLAKSCYESMFQDCTGLTSLPENLLPATTLAQFCYHCMFQGCIGLTSLPEYLLSSTNLVDYCYMAMFKGCTGLITPSNLPATTLKTCCYSDMFNGCSKLDSLTVSFTNWNPSNATSNWLKDAGTSATNCMIYCPKGLPAGDSSIPDNWSLAKTYEPFRFVAITDSTISLEKCINSAGQLYPVSLEYSTDTDGQVWTDYTVGTKIDLKSGESLYFRSKVSTGGYFNTPVGSNGTASYYNFSFSSDSNVNVMGNIGYLLEPDGNVKKIQSNYTFRGLFKDNNAIVSASDLELTSIVSSFCYYQAFTSNTSLVAGPVLPATNINHEATYEEMFKNCSKLSSLTVGFTDFNNSYSTINWVKGVASTGIFTCPSALCTAGTTTGAIFSTSKIPTGWTVVNK